MELIVEGFDKYGPIGSSTALPVFSLTTLAASFSYSAYQLTTSGLNPISIVAPLGPNGTAINLMGGASNPAYLLRSLGVNRQRIISGFQFQVGGFTDNNHICFFAFDGSVEQFRVVFTASGGINVYSGGDAIAHGGFYTGGGIVASSSSNGLFALGSSHFIEVDATVGTATSGGGITVYIDNKQVIAATGINLQKSGNPQINVVGLFSGGGATPTAKEMGNCSFTADGWYALDTFGSTNNGPLLSLPHIETTFTFGDVSDGFPTAQALLGKASLSINTTQVFGGGYQIFSRVVAQSSLSLTEIFFVTSQSNGSQNICGAVYADNAGSIGAKLSDGTPVVGQVAGVPIGILLKTPVTIVAGSTYWLAFNSDQSTTFQVQDNANNGAYAAFNFNPVAPASVSGVSYGKQTILAFGSGTPTLHASALNALPPNNTLSYVQNASSGDEDTVSFTPLAASAAVIYTTALSAFVRKSDSGAALIALETTSGGNKTAGSNPVIAPGASDTFVTTFVTNDPATGLPWKAAALNAAYGGIKVA